MPPTAGMDRTIAHSIFGIDDGWVRIRVRGRIEVRARERVKCYTSRSGSSPAALLRLTAACCDAGACGWVTGSGDASSSLPPCADLPLMDVAGVDSPGSDSELAVEHACAGSRDAVDACFYCILELASACCILCPDLFYRGGQDRARAAKWRVMPANQRRTCRRSLAPPSPDLLQPEAGEIHHTRPWMGNQARMGADRGPRRRQQVMSVLQCLHAVYVQLCVLQQRSATSLTAADARRTLRDSSCCRQYPIHGPAACHPSGACRLWHCLRSREVTPP